VTLPPDLGLRLLHAHPDPLLVADGSGTVVWANAAATSLLAPPVEGRRLDAVLAQVVTPGHPVVERFPLGPAGAEGGKEGGTEGVIIRTASGDPGASEGNLRTDRETRLSEERFRAMINDSADAIVVLDAHGLVTFWSTSAQRITGWAPIDVLGEAIFDWIHPEDLAASREAFRVMTTEPGDIGWNEFRFHHRDGRWLDVSTSARNLLDHPAVGGMVLNARDVTDTRELQNRYLRAQRLDVMERLAGGVAHEFNNVLSILHAHVHLLLEDLPPDDVAREDVTQIGRMAHRATDLIRGLLTFGVGGTVRRRVVDPGRVALDVERLLAPALGEDCRFRVEVAEDLHPIEVDPGQLEQALVNLLVNGRDAIRDGGELSLEVASAELDGGPAVEFLVIDDGIGMSAETQARIFEAFFTTKAPGAGTGLGLSTTRGIVEQAGGQLEVRSEPGKGSTFCIRLPALPGAQVDPVHRRTAAAACQGRGERILLVEDEEALRRMSSRALQDLGYEVIPASTAEEAIEQRTRMGNGVDLVVTDVVLPGLNGAELIHELRKWDPRVPVLFMSGYPDERVAAHLALHPEIPRLQKPFQPADLGRLVREILDTKRRRAPGRGARGGA